MSRLIVLAVSGFLASAVTMSPAMAQTGLGIGASCVGGVGPSGRACVALTALPKVRGINSPLDAAGGDQYPALDESQLGQTYECKTVEAAQQQGDAILDLIEDCGDPLVITETKPFYGTTGGTPAPTPVQPVAASAPAPVQTTIAAPAVAAPPVFAPVGVLPAGGLAPGLAFAGLGALGLVGIAALASGSSSTTTTTTTK